MRLLFNERVTIVGHPTRCADVVHPPGAAGALRSATAKLYIADVKCFEGGSQLLLHHFTIDACTHSVAEAGYN